MEHTTDADSALGAVIERDPLSPDEVAAFLDGRLTGDALERVEAHLADNPSARQEIIKASRIIASAPRRNERRTGWLPAAGLVAAAALVLVAVQPRSTARDAVPASAERRGVPEESDKINLVSPLDGQSLGSADISFAWHSIEGATYRIVVSDAAGRTLLQKNTTDTVVAVPESLLKTGSGTYYWSVDALAPDGSSVTSGVSEFVVAAH